MTTVESRPTTPSVQPDRPDAPTKLIVAMALAMLGAYLTILTPVIVSMSIRVAQIAPDDKSAALSTVLSVGAVLALIGNPFFGAMSDRTTSRLGRRRPWLLGGMLVGSAGLLIVSLGGNIPTLTAGWALAQLRHRRDPGHAHRPAADQIPPQQRGKVSGILGLMTSVAILAGSALAAALAGDAVLMFMVPALIGIATIVLLVGDPEGPPRGEGTLRAVRRQGVRPHLHETRGVARVPPGTWSAAPDLDRTGRGHHVRELPADRPVRLRHQRQRRDRCAGGDPDHHGRPC